MPNAIRKMPERAWTVARADCAISGLTRSDYSPWGVKALPPGVSQADYAALSGPAIDCLSRYVIWREERVPDFAGGDAPVVWTRATEWFDRADCVADPDSVVHLVVDCGGGTVDSPCNATGEWRDAAHQQIATYDIDTDSVGFYDFGVPPPGAVYFYIEGAFNAGCGYGLMQFEYEIDYNVPVNLYTVSIIGV